MAQTLIRKIDDATLEAFRSAAKAKGRSLEAELRELIESNRPRRALTPEERRQLSDEIVRGQKMSSIDSVLIIREARAALDARMSG